MDDVGGDDDVSDVLAFTIVLLSSYSISVRAETTFKLSKPSARGM